MSAAVTIIDIGAGNLGAVLAAFRRLDARVEVTRDPATIGAATRLVLPGVGAAGPVMQSLRDAGLTDVLRASCAPLLGICVGMQLLFERSDEGGVAGLALVPGEVRCLQPSPGVRVPHMGWNRLQRRAPSPLLDGIADDAQAYFVHGYAADGAHPDCIAACEHGQAIAAVVQRGHRAGVQFHPERSASTGARLLRNFLQWTPA